MTEVEEQFNSMADGYGCFYKPPYAGPIALETKMGVKFCKDVFLLKSFLDQQKIEYSIEDLEWSPMGMGLRIKRD